MTPPDRHPQTDGDNTLAQSGYAEGPLLHLEHGDLYVRQDGPRHAPPLVLIHGSGASLRSWDALVPLLTAHHRVIRVDLPGHGRSPEPLDDDYATPRQARAVGAALDRLGVARATVVGHSSGGYSATALAADRPRLVTDLVLINTGPGLDAFTGPEAVPIDPSQWPPTDEQIRAFASGAFHEGFEIPQAMIDDLRGMTYTAFVSSMQSSTDYLKERTLPDRLAPLGKPLLVIFGAEDRRWRPSSAADYGVVPGAKVEILPGAGHTPILEEPRQTAALLLPFTTRRNTGARSVT
ncbi:alpha/beta fold hydrolase [Streptomyces sp. NPDC050400]|uniref:alpha/beta fold hydrolase n=1 Tax=Streptomyces sp. NPDC050400 TaxID=3365610 RepID=UPI0037A07C57